MLVCDTSGLIACFDASDAHNVRVETAIGADVGPFVVSPYVLAEVDYLLATRRGTQAQLAVLGELAGGAWGLPTMEAADVRAAQALIGRPVRRAS